MSAIEKQGWLPADAACDRWALSVKLQSLT